MKKCLSFLLALICLFTAASGALAVDLKPEFETLKAQFVAGEGPVAGDYSVDYRYFSPVGENDSTKYPLVIWLHGMGEGGEEGAQIQKNNIAYWASDEFQSRFQPAGGAFILAARSREEDSNTWENSILLALRAAIDDFIAKNKDNIDLSRIYVGGFSMGGKMTFKMAIAYPEMFAAIFPICPAWSPSADKLELIKDIPVWITSSRKDPLVNFYLNVIPTWEKLCSVSNVVEDCRLTAVGTVCHADGTRADSGHHSWFAVNSDMFGVDDNPYPNTYTRNGLNKTVALTSPDGMISWLSSHTSDYDGAPATDMGNLEGAKNTDNFTALELSLKDFINGIINTIVSFICA